MKVFAVSLLCIGFAVQGSATEGSGEHPAGLADQPLIRIAEERAAATSEYERDVRHCYQRFAVSDCLVRSRDRLRARLDDLKRQETALRDADRRRRAVESEQRIREKSSAASPGDGS